MPQLRVYDDAEYNGIHDDGDDDLGDSDDEAGEGGDDGGWLPSGAEHGPEDDESGEGEVQHVVNRLCFDPAVKATLSFRKLLLMTTPVLHKFHDQLCGPFNGIDVVPGYAMTRR